MSPDAVCATDARVQRALDAIARGEFVVVADDEDRENEGDLIMAADAVDAAAIAFLVQHTSGLICVGITPERADELQLPPMVARNTESMGTAFTVSVDLREGTTTGISAADRAATIRALATPGVAPEDFARPGHVFPLRARPGGVLRRPGHTEAAVDLAALAGRFPAGVLCEIVNPDGTMCRGDDLVAFAQRHGLAYCTIADLIAWRRRREPLVERVSTAQIPAAGARFTAHAYRSVLDDIEHVAFVLGDVRDGEPVLVRVHSECFTGDLLGSLRCDCGPQLRGAIGRLAEEGAGVLLYLAQEGRGIGLVNKLRAYRLQDGGLDTLDANRALGYGADERDFLVAATMLRALGIERVRLLTNNPDKLAGLAACGIEVVGREPHRFAANGVNDRYLATKAKRFGHLLA